MTTQILVLRHAQTTWNAPKKRVQGQSSSADIRVSEQGAQQARPKLANLPKPSILILSPLLRCQQTVELWFETPLTQIPCDIIYDDGLKEIHMGQLEGLYVEEILQNPQYQPIWHVWKNDPQNFSGFPQGETLPDFQARVLASFAKICQCYNESNLPIAIVTHVGPMRMLKCFVNQQKLTQLWDYDFAPADSFYLSPDDIACLQTITSKHP